MKVLSGLFVLPALLGFSLANAQGISLYPGDKAPDLSFKRWLKGTLVGVLPEKGIAVVEFWATWCGTCKPWYPHLTELAKKRKDVLVLGVGIWEKDGSHVDKYLTEMGEQMDYNLAYSGEKDGMAATWMAASGNNGIPTAFVVKDRVIQWIGHPINLEKTLNEVTSGTFDVEKAKETVKKREADAAKNLEISNAIENLNKQFWDGDHRGAWKRLSELKKAHPEFPIVRILSTSWLSLVKKEDFVTEVVKLLEKDDEESSSNLGNVFMRCSPHKEVWDSLHTLAKKILESYSTNGDALRQAHQVFRLVDDKLNRKASAIKILAMYKEMRLEPAAWYKDQLEADAKG
jgi:thiol-disulfide isomerase/thioredoxin